MKPQSLRALGAALTVLLTCAASPELAHAAGFQNMGQSATANALGSVGTANPDEPNASFYNAANLALRDGFEIYLGGTILLPSSTHTPLEGGETTSTEQRLFPPPNIHLGLPIDLGSAGKLGVGFGLTLPYGLGITWPEDWAGREYIISQDLQTYNFNPNVSYKLPNIDLAVAVGAQIYHANVLLVRDAVLRDDTSVRSTISGSGQGYGATAALMFKPTETISIGLNYRSAADLNIEGQARFEGEEDTPFEQTFTDQAGSTVIPIPHAFTLGLGWTYERVFLGMDINYTTWSRYDRIDLQFSEPCQAGSTSCDPATDATDPPTTTIVSNWNDAVAIRLGLEYETLKDLKLRFGFVYDMTPVPERTLSPSLPDNDRAAFAAGLGYTFKGVRADFAFQRVNALTRTVVDTDNLPGVYTTSANIFGLNIGYGF